jgi:hypothetical protein
METTMKKIYWAAPLLLLAFLMVFAFGCQKKSGDPNGTSASDAGQIQILLGADTLRYLPGDSASTTVTVIVTSREGTVMKGQKVNLSLANPALGFIEFQNTSLVDTTDDFGRVNLLYTSVGTPGANVIIAVSGGVSAVKPVVALEATDVVCELNLVLSRDQLQTSSNIEDTVTVQVSISDCNHNAIVGVTIRMEATGGRLSPPLPTDSAGTARTIWYSNNQFGNFIIRARAGGLIDSQSVHVDSLPDIRGTLALTAQTLQIRADNCVTPDTLRAILQNQLGVAVVGDTVQFSTSLGGVANSYAITDSLGRATAVFCGVLPSVGDSNHVVAIFTRWGLFDTLNVWIDRALDVAEVNLSLGNQLGLVAGVDSTIVNTSVFFEDLSRVDGIPIDFYTSCGTFTVQSAILNNGSVQGNYYHACPQVTTPTNQVKVWAVVAGISSDTLPVQIIPGAARFIANIWALQDPIFLGQTDSVFALITDSLSNPVSSGQAVIFDSNLGTMNPVPATTAINGVAGARFTPGTQAGQANIRAWLGATVDSINITVISGQPNTIQLNVSNVSPQVQGTGGNSTSQLQATVNDANGNAVPDGTVVTFSIVHPGDPGGGININNHGLQDTALTAGGLAVATLNAGTNPGPVQVRACVLVNGVNICATNTSINIVAGPPANITIYPTNVGVDVGGDAYEVEISALVVDMFNNPVRCNTAVFFEVDPDTAQVVSDSVFVCNPNANGDVHLGMAYARLRYNSNATFQTVYITARTGEANPISEQIEYILPLQQPTIALNCDPNNWCFDISGTPCRIKCNVVVYDGHSTPINGATIDYGVQRGQFWTQSNGGVNRNWAITGPEGNPQGENGETALWLRGETNTMFPDPLVPEASDEVTVGIHGYPAATDAELVLMRRGCGPGPN